MHVNSLNINQVLPSDTSAVFTDNLHDIAFKNLSISIQPMDSTASYTYTVFYGAVIKAGPTSVTGGKFSNYYDATLLPPNNPRSNWSQQGAGHAGNMSNYAGITGGVPISVLINNTSANSSGIVFNVSFISETFGWVTG